MEKTLVKKKARKNCFGEQEKSWAYLNTFRKNYKNLKATWFVWGHSKPKILTVGQPW